MTKDEFNNSGFQQRVKLLEYWAPSLLSKLKDLDDLADCILSVWDTAEAHTEQRIIKLLEDRLTGAKETKKLNGQITAMRVSVVYEQLEAITEAIIYAIKNDNK